MIQYSKDHANRKSFVTVSFPSLEYQYGSNMNFALIGVVGSIIEEGKFAGTKLGNIFPSVDIHNG